MNEEELREYRMSDSYRRVREEHMDFARNYDKRIRDHLSKCADNLERGFEYDVPENPEYGMKVMTLNKDTKLLIPLDSCINKKLDLTSRLRLKGFDVEDIEF